MEERESKMENRAVRTSCRSSTFNPPSRTAALRSSILDPRSSLPIGLLAGAGRFPIVFAEKARQIGIPVVCVGVRDAASPELIGLTERFYWTGIAQLGRTIRCFKREGVERAVMA